MKIKPLLSVKNLSISFEKKETYRQVLQGVRFDVQKNEILGVVGESGSGKSITALAVMQLLKNAKVEGEIVFKGVDLNTLQTKKIEAIRGKKISMIFQEPMSALNPSMKCGEQVSEVLLQHETISEAEADSAVERKERFGIWGGKSERERRAIRRERRTKANRPRPNGK